MKILDIILEAAESQQWMSDSDLDNYIPEKLVQEWRELLGYDYDGNPHPLWYKMTGVAEPNANNAKHRLWMVRVANTWLQSHGIPITVYKVRDADDELEWIATINQQGMHEAAGDPENPGRRGFLKALGAAGVAAAMPGAAAGALAAPAAAAAEIPVAAAATATPEILAALMQAAVISGDNSEWGRDEDDWARGPSWDHEERDEADWENNIGNNPGWNDKYAEYQGTDGVMPWGEGYEIQTSPAGNPYLYTASPYGEVGVITFWKNGRAHVLELSWDSYSHGLEDVLGATDDDDEELYYQFTEEHGDLDENEMGNLIDYIVSRSIERDAAGKSQFDRDREEWNARYMKTPASTSTTQTTQRPDADQPTSGPDSTLADLARLAGLAQRSGEKLSSIGEPDKPQELPAPTRPDIDLTPNLKQRQQEPVKRKPDES